MIKLSQVALDMIGQDDLVTITGLFTSFHWSLTHLLSRDYTVMLKQATTNGEGWMVKLETVCLVLDKQNEGK